MYDSAEDTCEHIGKVRQYLDVVRDDLYVRQLDHDATKLQEPEKSLFDEYTPKLKDSTYGSDEYFEFLKGLKPALDHHYSSYRHHPEHFDQGVSDMNLIDVLEMLVDWKAASERHDNGDIYKSIEINAKRFGYGEEFKNLLINTARYLQWKK